MQTVLRRLADPPRPLPVSRRPSPRHPLQARADASQAVMQLRQIAVKSRGVIQRNGDEVDPTVLFVSMTPDGMVGSIYFDGGRIRTTHGHGPEDDKKAYQRRFNINIVQAWAEFRPKDPRELSKIDKYDNDFNDWLVNEKLKGAPYPPWAELISADTPPRTAADHLSRGDAIVGNTILYEFTDLGDGDFEYHPSRGAAVRLSLTKNEVAALRAAIVAAEKLKPEKGDGKYGLADRKNSEFYSTLQKRLAALAPASTLLSRIRTPQYFTG